MILHDRATLVVPGGKDAKGNPKPDTEQGPFPVAIRPLKSSESVSRGAPPLSAYYRMVIGAKHGADLTHTGRVKWDGYLYMVQGDVEPHRVVGRTHHLEATLLRV